MQGSLGEFTLAELLQLFALAEKTGTLTISVADRTSRLYLEAGRIAGWGIESFDVLAEIQQCELLSPATVTALESIEPGVDRAGMAFIVRNVVEPSRWDAFVQRQIEQDVYPLLSVETGEFDAKIDRLPPVPLSLNISVQQLVLDGSRWEADMSELASEGFSLESRWRRREDVSDLPSIGFSQLDWLVWNMLAEERSVNDVAARICHPDIETIESVRRLDGEGIIRRVT